MIQSNIARNATMHDFKGAGRQSMTQEYTDRLYYFPFDVNDEFFSIFRLKATESRTLFKNAKKGLTSSEDTELKFQRWLFMLCEKETLEANQTDSTEWADPNIPEITFQICTRYLNVNALIYKGDRAYINSYLVNPYLVGGGFGSKFYYNLEAYFIRKYGVKRIFLEPLFRRERGARPKEDAGIFWKKMGFDYPSGAEILQLNEKARRGEPPERVNISEAQLNIASKKRGIPNYVAPHKRQTGMITMPDGSQQLAERIWVAEAMWKDVSKVDPSQAPTLPYDVLDEVDFAIIGPKHRGPNLYFDYDDADPTKMSRKPIHELSYDRNNKDSITAMIRRAYIGLCNPKAAVKRKAAPAPPRIMTGQRARTATVRYANKPQAPGRQRNVLPALQQIDNLVVTPVVSPVAPPTLVPAMKPAPPVIPPDLAAAAPPAVVLNEPQKLLTDEEIKDREQMFTDFIRTPLTLHERQEHQRLFNRFLQRDEHQKMFNKFLKKR